MKLNFRQPSDGEDRNAVLPMYPQRSQSSMDGSSARGNNSSVIYDRLPFPNRRQHPPNSLPVPESVSTQPMSSTAPSSVQRPASPTQQNTRAQSNPHLHQNMHESTPTQSQTSVPHQNANVEYNRLNVPDMHLHHLQHPYHDESMIRHRVSYANTARSVFFYVFVALAVICTPLAINSSPQVKQDLQVAAEKAHEFLNRFEWYKTNDDWRPAIIWKGRPSHTFEPLPQTSDESANVTQLATSSANLSEQGDNTSTQAQPNSPEQALEIPPNNSIGLSENGFQQVAQTQQSHDSVPEGNGNADPGARFTGSSHTTNPHNVQSANYGQPVNQQDANQQGMYRASQTRAQIEAQLQSYRHGHPSVQNRGADFHGTGSQYRAVVGSGDNAAAYSDGRSSGALTNYGSRSASYAASSTQGKKHGSFGNGQSFDGSAQQQRQSLGQANAYAQHPQYGSSSAYMSSYYQGRNPPQMTQASSTGASAGSARSQAEINYQRLEEQVKQSKQMLDYYHNHGQHGSPQNSRAGTHRPHSQNTQHVPYDNRASPQKRESSPTQLRTD